MRDQLDVCLMGSTRFAYVPRVPIRRQDSARRRRAAPRRSPNASRFTKTCRVGRIRRFGVKRFDQLPGERAERVFAQARRADQRRIDLIPPAPSAKIQSSCATCSSNPRACNISGEENRILCSAGSRIANFTWRLLGSIGLYFAGHWLVLDEGPAPADLIVLLGGDLLDLCTARICISSRLCKADSGQPPGAPAADGESASVGIRLPRQDEQYREILQRKGVPAKAVSVFGEGNLSTVQEAETRAAFLGRQPARLLIVTFAISHTPCENCVHAFAAAGGYSRTGLAV